LISNQNHRRNGSSLDNVRSNPPIAFSKSLLKWYDQNRRDLPWRSAPTPYATLVSEFMLQQTQVSTVIPYFQAFMKRFPTVEALAAGSEQEVLRLWQGLGYYSRARNLQASARKIISDFSGDIPRTIEQLQTLPGIGRYTAGAIASIAYDVRAPILDGNVARVLCRLDCIRSDPRLRKTQLKLWKRAEEILPTKRVGDFNSALMELGATVCTPRAPKCPTCPVKNFCKAAKAGLADQIPPPRAAKPTPLVRRLTLCLQNRSRWLIEQRPIPGRWAGLWQFVTIPESGRPPESEFSKSLEVKIASPKSLAQIRHALTHRRYIFEVFTANTNIVTKSNGRRWVTLSELSKYPLPRPHEKIAAILRELNKSNAN
jgi:A/G-specific adenine glycosylase